MQADRPAPRPHVRVGSTTRRRPRSLTLRPERLRDGSTFGSTRDPLYGAAVGFWLGHRTDLTASVAAVDYLGPRTNEQRLFIHVAVALQNALRHGAPSAVRFADMSLADIDAMALKTLPIGARLDARAASGDDTGQPADQDDHQPDDDAIGQQDTQGDHQPPAISEVQPPKISTTSAIRTTTVAGSSTRDALEHGSERERPRVAATTGAWATTHKERLAMAGHDSNAHRPKCLGCLKCRLLFTVDYFAMDEGLRLPRVRGRTSPPRRRR
jgi:hypothetical protein